MMYPSLFSSDLVHYLLHGSILKSSRPGYDLRPLAVAVCPAVPPCQTGQWPRAVPRLRGSLVRDVCMYPATRLGGTKKVESTRAGSRRGRAPERSAVFPSRRRDVTRERDCAECVSVCTLSPPPVP